VRLEDKTVYISKIWKQSTLKKVIALNQNNKLKNASISFQTLHGTVISNKTHPLLLRDCVTSSDKQAHKKV